MKTTSRSRKLKPNPDYKPRTVLQGDEMFPNGIFIFNISRINEDILNKQLLVEEKKGLIHAFKLRGERLLPYFTKKKSYLCYIDYWNDKLKVYSPEGNL